MNLNDAIGKIYVITDNDHKHATMQKRFDAASDGTVKANITRFNKVDISGMSDEHVKTVTTPACNELCSDKSISRWMSHKRLWEQIVDQKEDKVLILEDDAAPVDLFYELLEECWRYVPKDWDVVYLGSQGSGDGSMIKDVYYRVWKNKINTSVNDYVIEPGYPTALYGYIIRHSAAKKLIDSGDLDKVDLSLDRYLAERAFASKDNNDFKVYSLVPDLVTLVDVDKEDEDLMHSVTHPLTDTVDVSDNQTLSDVKEDDPYFVRKLGVSITNNTLMFMLAAFIVGSFANFKHASMFFVVTMVLQLSELAYGDATDDKLKNLMFELGVGVLAWLVGRAVYMRRRKNML